MKKILAGGLCFIVGGCLSFFGIQFFLKTGIFKIPGEIVFDESVSDKETYATTLADI